jgi:hypothetical protein
MHFVIMLVILTVNSDQFLKQHYPVDLCNGEVWCSLWGTDWILIYYLYEAATLKGYKPRTVLAISVLLLFIFSHSSKFSGPLSLGLRFIWYLSEFSKSSFPRDRNSICSLKHPSCDGLSSDFEVSLKNTRVFSFRLHRSSTGSDLKKNLRLVTEERIILMVTFQQQSHKTDLCKNSLRNALKFKYLWIIINVSSKSS